MAVNRKITPIGIPVSKICPYNICPGATLIVATAVEKALTLPSIPPGTSFYIKVRVKTLDKANDIIIAIPQRENNKAIR